MLSASRQAARRTPKQAGAPLVAKRFAHKELRFSNEGRQALLAGVEILEKAVSVTLGPKGRNVIIEQGKPPSFLRSPSSLSRALACSPEIF